MNRPFLIPLVLLLLAGLLAACDAAGGEDIEREVDGIKVCPQEGLTYMTGAGASFPFPLLSNLLHSYHQICGTQVNYQSIGSGGGIRQVQAWAVDWGASEAIMGAEERETAQGGHVLHIPLTLGSIAITYNIPGIGHAELRLTPEVLAGIYLKQITRWNDTRIREINPELELPDMSIAVIHRSDGSGTTYMFTHYLAQISDEWADTVGFATSVRWPGDIAGPGNEGVANQVQQVPGSIGYIERTYALQVDLPWAQVQNQAGNWMEPTLEASAAAADIEELPADMEVMVTDTPNPDGYPIAGFTWYLIYEEQRDLAVADAVARMIYWSLTEGQDIATQVGYVPIVGQARERSLQLVGRISYDGQPVLPELGSLSGLR